MTNALIEVPQLSGGRRRARRLFQDHDSFVGQVVILDCSQMVAGTASFADEVVRIVLEEGHADRLVVQNVANEFGTYFLDSAKDIGLDRKLEVV